MSRWEQDWRPEPHLSPPHGLETERRLTRLEMTSEDHGETLDHHEKRHDDQATWNKGFAIALAGLGAGLAHAKASDVVELLIAVLQRFRT